MEVETHSSIIAWRIPWTEEPGSVVHGVAKSRTRLKWLSSSSSLYLEKEVATHSSILAWRILWTEEPGGLPSAAVAAAKSLQLCLTLCDPVDGSPPGSSVPGILQARILEWVVIFFSHACMLSCISHVWLCVTLQTAARSSVHRILQARILEWVAISFSITYPSYLQSLWNCYKDQTPRGPPWWLRW